MESAVNLQALITVQLLISKELAPGSRLFLWLKADGLQKLLQHFLAKVGTQEAIARQLAAVWRGHRHAKVAAILATVPRVSSGSLASRTPRTQVP